MTALKNVAHLIVLGIWAVAGLAFTFNSLFGVATLGAVLIFWLWFAGFAAVTSMVVQKFNNPLAALATHGAALVVLASIPRVFPLNLLRIGYDLLVSR